MIFGIDISLNSTGITKLDGNSVQFYSILRSEKPEKTLKDPLINKLKESNIINFNIVKKTKLNNYSEQEVNKVLMINEISNLLNIILTVESNFCVGIEGFAYGAKGNAVFDIAQLTGVLRNTVIQKINNNNNFKIISPAEIKSFATSKGNANKIQMFDSFLTKSNNHLTEFIQKNKDLCISKKGEIQKPLDDIIDSWWVSQLIKD